MFKSRRMAEALLCVALIAAVVSTPAGATEENGVVASATGSGHFTAGGELRTFSFSAVERADGTVSGEWQVVSRVGNGTRLHGSVTCLAVVGNRAWVGTVIEDSDNPIVLIGSEGGFRVVDNGEGGEPPDQTSVAFFNGVPGFARNYCNNMPANPPLNNVEHGNIQVVE